MMEALAVMLSCVHGYAPSVGLGLSRAPARAAAPLMMPLGVPKVAYRAPGSIGADWIDLYNRMYREVCTPSEDASEAHARVRTPLTPAIAHAEDVGPQ